tara:strand:+ start:204 stop:344 length:141 start_codon:yes stop_codon:yes gene_type:complete
MKTNDLIFDRSFVNVKWSNQKKTPFGGLKFSGLGREVSKYAIEDYL